MAVSFTRVRVYIHTTFSQILQITFANCFDSKTNSIIQDVLKVCPSRVRGPITSFDVESCGLRFPTDTAIHHGDSVCRGSFLSNTSNRFWSVSPGLNLQKMVDIWPAVGDWNCHVPSMKGYDRGTEVLLRDGFTMRQIRNVRIEISRFQCPTPFSEYSIFSRFNYVPRKFRRKLIYGSLYWTVRTLGNVPWPQQFLISFILRWIILKEFTSAGKHSYYHYIFWFKIQGDS